MRWNGWKSLILQGMESRIKTLYIITIIAIITFLGMQIYWLYGRYEFSLREHERTLSGTVIDCVDKYAVYRDKSPTDYRVSISKHKTDSIIPINELEIKTKGHFGDSIQISRKSTIKTYFFSAQELLGLEPDAKLTDEQKYKAAELAEQQMCEPADSTFFDASGAKDDTEAWIATKNVLLERKEPFTIEGIDSVLRSAGISARISISQADSTIWQIKEICHNLTPSPELSITIPYSQLEGRTVTVTCSINPLDVLPDIWDTLIITLLVSCLLIVCLILQFSTVRKLSRLDKMRNSFIVTMIHELKRPISTLKMCVSCMDNERMMEDKDTKKELLSETRNALDILSSYFSKLRDISFNNVEQIPLNIRSINLCELFENVAAATVFPPGKTVTINNNIDRSIEVSADRSHLYNILNNLVENAIKYSGTAVIINADATENNGTLELHLNDNGNGISSGDIKHIFKRFYRGKGSAGEYPGMGLGLTYVKLLIDAHGGDISVESEEGKGTCFTIRLPQ